MQVRANQGRNEIFEAFEVLTWCEIRVFEANPKVRERVHWRMYSQHATPTYSNELGYFRYGSSFVYLWTAC